MRKKLDTRFPASRIKKIMQADEDVGKIAMAVPLLVSKALELFLQDLCDRTYDITLKRGVKTVNSLHLKQCVQSFNVFDFLRDIVSRVPELGGSEAAGEGSAARKRKANEDEGNDSDDETKKSHMFESGHHTSGRGSGRGRGRGRGRPSRALEKESTSHCEKFEDDPDSFQPDDENKNRNTEKLDNGLNLDDRKNSLVGENAQVPIRNFDLNVDLNDNTDAAALSTGAPATATSKPLIKTKHEEYPGWSLADMKSMAIDPLQLAKLNQRFDEEEEDYDEDG